MILFRSLKIEYYATVKSKIKKLEGELYAENSSR